MHRWVHWTVIGALALATPGLAHAKCEFGRIAALPITMESLRPLLTAKINGRDARFILDSGAFYSMIPSSVAAQFGLKTHSGPFGLQVKGIGGSTSAEIATVKEFTLLTTTIKNVEFLVGGSDMGYDGLLGQNLLESFDVEYDLAHGLITLYKSQDCAKTRLAYWVEPGQQYSTMPLEPTDPLHAHTIGSGTLNGQHIRIIFDSGAFTSVLSLRAAARAGIKPDSAGVIDGGSSRGLGRDTVRSYIATFDSFKIGDSEEIRHARLRFQDISEMDADMLLGADFFVSHRIMVGNREHRLFLTYNGGAVFDLSHHAPQVAQAAGGEGGGGAAPAPDEGLTDPAELSRRGSALAARRDFQPGLADLSRAVELAPNDPEYRYQRANAYLANGEADKALSDLDRVIELKRDFLPAYTPRAEIRMTRRDPAGALADLDTVSSLAPKEADLRYTLGTLYQHLERLPAAIQQYTLWMASHSEDSRLPTVRLHRCLCGALQNQDLKLAQADCDYALHHLDKKAQGYAAAYVNRGLVHLRQSDFDRALSDFNDALKVEPDNAAALYGRALAEGRRNQSADAGRDLAQSSKLNPVVATRLAKWGFVP